VSDNYCDIASFQLYEAISFLLYNMTANEVMTATQVSSYYLNGTGSKQLNRIRMEPVQSNQSGTGIRMEPVQSNQSGTGIRMEPVQSN